MNPYILALVSVAPSVAWSLLRKRRLKPEEIREQKNKKLRALIRHSYRNVPYYNHLLKEARLSPEDIRTVDDLHKIPTTSKRDIVDQPLERVFAADMDRRQCRVMRTSGTSGLSLTIYRARRELVSNYVSQFLWRLECGDKMTKESVAIGVSHPPPHPFEKMGIFRAIRISPFEDPRTQIKQIMEIKPYTLHVTPSSGMVLSKEIRDNDVKLTDLNVVFSGGEMLDEYTRKLEKEAFGVDVFSHYGANETGRMGCECIEHNGYHEWGRTVHAEITKEGKTVSPGEEGEVTITSLANYTMPFIRYNLEDLGILVEEDSCSCGNPHRKLKLTAGRKRDLIHLPNGTVIPAAEITGRMTVIEGIRQSQIIQESIGQFTVLMVKGPKFNAGTTQEVRNVFRLIGAVEYTFSFQDSIPREKSGKFKHFVSKIPAEAV